MFSINRITESMFANSLKILSSRDRRKIYVVIILQTGLGILDLVGIAIIGVLGALSVSGIQSKRPGGRVQSVLNIVHLQNHSIQSQAAILGCVAAVLLIGRTLLSVFFTRRFLIFISNRGAIISSQLISKLLSRPLLEIQATSTQETLHALTFGVRAITLEVIGSAILLSSDFSMLIIVSIGLLYVDPLIAIGSFTFFALISYIMYKLLNIRAQTLGKSNSELMIKGSEKILEVLGSYRESVVRNRREYYAREIAKNRHALASVTAEIQFMPNISKYVIESSVVLGALLLSSIQFFIQDASHAVASLFIFLAAGSRIAPAVMRIQQGVIQMKNSLASSKPTLDLIYRLEDYPPLVVVSDELDRNHSGFESGIDISDLTLTYPNVDSPALSGINIHIEPGSIVAVVGPSGAGKTSLVDALLGILLPDFGDIKISGIKPLDSIARWPGAISYVPQDIMVINGTIRENICVGFPKELATDQIIDQALKIAHLDSFVASLPMGKDTKVGEKGNRISGGQRQRLGIARAMFTNPKLLVLDEATSALDGETESLISDAIQELKGQVTVVMIAHRLSTVRHADLIIYLDKGKLITSGSFDDVRREVPDFDRQAKLMGLN